ncbi:hypothetical protein DY000_02013619 [Brassica cretica]|uniref:Uncharacterized protein n=1 Tax=Brassica cretica TaxID=69181 RepID=A0ABQ7CND5_BRACR|nr:hypothetical protein DY000_02013619 [Brassica cretica]
MPSSFCFVKGNFPFSLVRSDWTGLSLPFSRGFLPSPSGKTCLAPFALPHLTTIALRRYLSSLSTHCTEKIPQLTLQASHTRSLLSSFFLPSTSAGSLHDQLAMVLSSILLLSSSAGSLHDQLAMAMVTKPPWTEPQVISPLSQHPLYPLWNRLCTSPQNVGNRLHFSIVTTSSLPSLEQTADFSLECWQ